jgi:hypothetical protein
MAAFISSREATLKSIPSSEYREDIYFSAADASRFGVRQGEYGILRTTHVVPDAPGREYAVRLVIGDGREAQQNTLMINSTFYDELQFGLGQEWELRRADNYQAIHSLALEPSVEQERLREDLKRLRRDTFVGRCLLAQPGQTFSDLSVRVAEQAYFNIHDMIPAPTTLYQPTVLGIEANTEVNLFVPHSKGGVDMVIIVDASNSMDLSDYVDRTQTLRRIQAAYRALETLLERRLYTGSRVSRFALIGFGKDAHVVYPPNGEEMIELTVEHGAAMRSVSPNLVHRVERNGSNVAEALDTAAELLYKNAREENEKVIVLLSDGAHWTEKKDTGFHIEFSIGKDDPVMFADNLYDEGQIRVHTVAISNAENVSRYEPVRYREDMIRPEGERVWIPNPKMLSEIARRTRAKFFPSPDAEVLNKLFDELGEGAIFPLF